MPLPIFTFSVDANNAIRTINHRTKIAQFGDGYKQLAPAGINNKVDTWSLTLPMLTGSEVALVEAFFDPLGQHGHFNWTPPRGAEGIYRLTEPIKYQANGLDRPQFLQRGTRTTVTLSIERVYIGVAVIIPPPPPAPTSVFVFASGITGWNITRSGTTTDAIVVNYVLSVTPDGGSATFISGTISIPSGSSSGFVAISNATGNRSEILKVGVGMGYTVGSPSSASIAIAPATPTVSVVANGDNSGWTITRSFATTTPLTVSYRLAVTPNGSATITTTDSIQIAANSSSVFVPISNNPASTKNEVLTIDISTGYTLGSPSSASIAIAPPAPSVSVVANGDNSGWTITRSIATTTPLTVSYSYSATPSGGTTTTTSASVQIAANSNSVFVSIGNTSTSRTESLAIVASAGYTIGSPGNASITIVPLGILLLLKFQGADNSPILDTSPSPKTIQVFGNAKILNNKCVFDGNSGAYLQINRSELNIRTAPTFTIEAIFTPAVTDDLFVLGTYFFPSTSYHLSFKTNTITNNADPAFYTSSVIANQQVHIAIVKDSSNIRTYKNGALNTDSAYTNVSVIEQVRDFYIGRNTGVFDQPNNAFNGSISGIRITSGVRYTSNFTPPSTF